MRTRVDIDGRTFFVTFEDGQPKYIKERKTYMPGTYMESLYETVYWSPKHHKLGGPKTITARVIKAAINKAARDETNLKSFDSVEALFEDLKS